VALIDEIAPGASVAFDTNALIYYVEEHTTYLPLLDPVFEMVKAGEIIGHVSVITLSEVLVGPLHAGLSALANSYREIFSARRDFILHPVTIEIAERAARIRASLQLKAPDAIVVATALEHGCPYIVTNDSAFRKVEGLKVLVINDFVEKGQS
jgi:predicted nucleic acid-binding protein